MRTQMRTRRGAGRGRGPRRSATLLGRDVTGTPHGHRDTESTKPTRVRHVRQLAGSMTMSELLRALRVPGGRRAATTAAHALCMRSALDPSLCSCSLFR